MKKFLIIITIILNHCFVWGQSTLDTIYYNNEWDKTTKYDFNYYRVVKKERTAYKVVDHYKSGKVQMVGTFTSMEPPVRIGKFTFYSEDGRITSEENYQTPTLQGTYKTYYSSNKLRSVRYYNKGHLDEEVLTYYPSGQLKRKDIFDFDKLIWGRCYTASGKDTDHYDFIHIPRYPGGESELQNFIVKNIVYPHQAKSAGIQGTVKVAFTVDTAGFVVNPWIVESVDSVLDKEALRVVSLLGKWIPGMEEDEKRSYTLGQPIKFSLNGNKNIGDTTILQRQGVFSEINISIDKRAIQVLSGNDFKSKKLLMDSIVLSPNMYNPPVLYELSRQFLLTQKKNEAMYWFYLAQLRARYDANRCLDNSAKDAVYALNEKYGYDINKFAFKDLKALETVVDQVIKYVKENEETYDCRWINLCGMDAIISSLGKDEQSRGLSEPKENWAEIKSKTINDYETGFNNAIKSLHK